MTTHQLRQARQVLGWTIARLAVASGTSEYVISKLEQYGHAPAGYPLARADDPVAAILTTLRAAGVSFDGDGPIK